MEGFDVTLGGRVHQDDYTSMITADPSSTASSHNDLQIPDPDVADSNNSQQPPPPAPRVQGVQGQQNPQVKPQAHPARRLYIYRAIDKVAAEPSAKQSIYIRTYAFTREAVMLFKGALSFHPLGESDC